MSKVRPLGSPIGLDFLELNLRTYILYKGEPGVYFFSLDASSWPAVLGARLVWDLPYLDAVMASSEQHPTAGVSIHLGSAPPPPVPPTAARLTFSSHRKHDGAGLEMEYSVGQRLPASRLGSVQFFLLERYYLFVESGGAVWKGQVHHPPYEVFEASLLSMRENITSSTGLVVTSEPVVLYSPGVEISAYGPWRLSALPAASISYKSLGAMAIAIAFLVITMFAYWRRDQSSSRSERIKRE